MYDKILLAVGGDDASFAPARVAGRLANLLGAQLTIATVYRATSHSLGEPYYSESLVGRIDETEGVIETARRLAEEQGASVTAVEPLSGPPVDKIVELARDGGFDLIILGTRRRGRLQSALLGSVSAGVAAHSKVPVLVVPEEADFDRDESTSDAVAGHAGR